MAASVAWIDTPDPSSNCTVSADLPSHLPDQYLAKVADCTAMVAWYRDHPGYAVTHQWIDDTADEFVDIHILDSCFFSVKHRATTTQNTAIGNVDVQRYMKLLLNEALADGYTNGHGNMTCVDADDAAQKVDLGYRVWKRTPSSPIQTHSPRDSSAGSRRAAPPSWLTLR
ncbi:Uu.00g100610.m01.CDS01 [Anthostomella pinea]|uniref:Uu.00g100610.m01.CDS01 n=1 Tax=Anthostomella pinea TaxID=933095 RepID=A0AAI8YF88_9PEZI|nr:Uu.00g100610.m01.CDS01 [Anthostomella pinea]